MIIELLLSSLIGGLFSLVGGLILVWKQNLAKRIITPLLSFAAGSFMAAAFLDILPEALEEAADSHLVLISVLVGFISFFIIERFLMTFFYRHLHEKDEHSAHTESLPILLVIGDGLHNFLDGIVIAFAFLADPSLGLITAIAIAAHEVPQEIGDFSILLHSGWAKRKVITVNIALSLLTIPGVFLGFFAGHLFETELPYLLAVAAGIFIYISASDIIPEVHHQAGHKHFYKVIIPFISAIVLLGYLISATHG